LRYIDRGYRHRITGKITDARIGELKRLRDKRDGLKGKIKKEKEGIQAILDSIDELTQDSTQSSSRAAKDKQRRQKDESNFSHDDAIEIYQMAIKRLEEDYTHVVEELENLEQLIN
jgi:prefoldin subunit 5